MEESKIIEMIITNGGSVVSILIFIVYLNFRDNKYALLLEKVSIALTEIIQRLREHNDDHKKIIDKSDKIIEITAKCPHN